MPSKRKRPQDEGPRTHPDRNEFSTLNEAIFLDSCPQALAFPRGTANVLARPRAWVSRQEQDIVTLFEENHGNDVTSQKDINSRHNKGYTSPDLKTSKKSLETSKKKRKLSHDRGHENLGLPATDRLDSRDIKYGMLVLIRVLEVGRHKVHVALPHDLDGWIRSENISNGFNTDIRKPGKPPEEGPSMNGNPATGVLNSFLEAGQYLRGFVQGTDYPITPLQNRRRQISLSTMPSKSNSGLRRSDIGLHTTLMAEIVSVEERGLVMDPSLENDNVKAFMPIAEMPDHIHMTTATPGMVIFCCVIDFNAAANVLTLSANLHKASYAPQDGKHTKPSTTQCLLPGTWVEVLVSKVTSSGFSGTLTGGQKVTADIVHSGMAFGHDSNLEVPSPGEKVSARILYQVTGPKGTQIGVSILKHVLSLSTLISNGNETEPQSLKRLMKSPVVEKIIVHRAEAKLGLFLKLEALDVRGFTRFSQISEESEAQQTAFRTLYLPGSTHRGRIMGYNSLDGLFSISFRQTVLNKASAKDFEDFAPGRNAEGVIRGFTESLHGETRLVLSLGENITGFVPKTHLGGFSAEQSIRQIPKGSKLVTRVLAVDQSKGQIRLTLNKFLMEETSVWSTYSRLSTGMSSWGVVQKVSKSGAIVEFYSDILGFLPASEAGQMKCKDCTQIFHIGQALKVSILSVDAEARRMTLKCQDSWSSEPIDSQDNPIHVGAVISSAVVTKITESELVLRLERLLTPGILSIWHLLDASSKSCQSLAKRFRVGQRLSKLLVLDMTPGVEIKLTRKPSLLEAYKQGRLPKNLQEAQGQKDLVGFVDAYGPLGLHVRFAGKLTGLVPKSKLPNTMTESPDYGLHLNQSLCCRIQSVDVERCQLLLATRCLDIRDEGLPLKLNEAAEVSEPPSTLHDGRRGLSLGEKVQATILSVKKTQLNVRLDGGSHGRVDISEVFDSWDSIKDHKHPLAKFKVKQQLSVRVLGIHDSRNHRYLPITNRGKAPVYEVSARPSVLRSDKIKMLTLDDLDTGSAQMCFVNNVTEDHIWTSLSPILRGRISALDALENSDPAVMLPDRFHIGRAIQAVIKNIDLESGQLDLSLRGRDSTSPRSIEDLHAGLITFARIVNVMHQQLVVQMSGNITAHIYLVDLEDDFSCVSVSNYRKNQIIRASVIDVDIPKNQVFLSTRQSRLSRSPSSVKDAEVVAWDQLNVDEIVRGFVKNFTSSGIQVAVGTRITAFVKISDISDDYVKDWKASFHIGQLVRGRVISIEPHKTQILLSLKNSSLQEGIRSLFTHTDFHVGQITSGRVRKVEDFGVFVVLEGSANVSGLCHRSEMAEEHISQVHDLFREGDIVKVKVLNIKIDKRQISLGMKPSYFSDVEQSLEAFLGDTRQESSHSIRGNDTDSNSPAKELPLPEARSVSINSKKGEESYQNLINVGTSTNNRFLKTSGFDWTGESAFGTLSGDSFSSTFREAPKKNEHNFQGSQPDMTSRLDLMTPRKNTDFERLLMSRPFESQLWLEYISFHLQRSDLLAARDVAERATLSTRTQDSSDEEKKLDIWLAYLNMEISYGSDEAFEDVLRRACSCNDSEKVHGRLCSALIRLGKLKKADNLLQSMTKQFSYNPKVWVNRAHFYFDTKKSASDARSILPKALQSVPLQSHVELISKFAQLEFRSPSGDAEFGRTMFEKLLTSFPKRSDLWTILLDLEIKYGGEGRVRALFQRATSGTLKKHATKFLYQKWLHYEEEHGNELDREKVYSMAARYI